MLLRKIIAWVGSLGSSSDLPTTFNQPSQVPDGSGKSIKLESPLAKALRSADGYIKGTYVWFFISVFFIWGGWSLIRRNSASMVLDCDADGCTLAIQTPYSFLPRNSQSGVPIKTKSRSKRRIKIELKRDQLVRADNIKWNPKAQMIVENYGLNSPTFASQQPNTEEQREESEERHRHPRKNRNKRKNKKHKRHNPAYSNRGPDKDGNYHSYVIVLRDPLLPPSSESSEEDADPNESPSKTMQRKMAARHTLMAAQHDLMMDDPNSLASLLAPFSISANGVSQGDSMEYLIHPRDFNPQTRRLARTIVAKIVAYSKGRRSSCIVRESRPVSWQGLVLLILGIFSLVLCLLLGQFWEEHDPTQVGSYRQRMAEIRKRNEATKLRQKRGLRRKPLPKRQAAAQPALKRQGAAQPPLKRPDDVQRSMHRASDSVRISAAGTTMRVRRNAGANRAD